MAAHRKSCAKVLRQHPLMVSWDSSAPDVARASARVRAHKKVKAAAAAATRAQASTPPGCLACGRVVQRAVQNASCLSPSALQHRPSMTNKTGCVCTLPALALPPAQLDTSKFEYQDGQCHFHSADSHCVAALLRRLWVATRARCRQDRRRGPPLQESAGMTIQRAEISGRLAGTRNHLIKFGVRPDSRVCVCLSA